MDGRSVKKLYADRRWREAPGGKRVICNFCKHKREIDFEKAAMSCDAFPQGIPRDVLLLVKTEKDFSKECSGNGVKFEVAKEYENEDWE